jgi:hypothetical protein
MEVRIDMEKNYFEIVNPNYLNKEFYLEEYKYPDSDCKELYDDLKALFFSTGSFPCGKKLIKSETKERKKNGEKFWELVLTIDDNTIFGLGSDFLGPSTYWAKAAGVDLQTRKQSISITRKIGGHIFWPRWIKPCKGEFISGLSINCAKGGEKGFFDRIDLTLFDLQSWYAGNRSCKLKSVFDKNSIWLMLFVDFNKFINFFNLDAFTIEGNHGELLIRDLTSPFGETVISGDSKIPIVKYHYMDYMQKNENAIYERSANYRITHVCKQ